MEHPRELEVGGVPRLAADPLRRVEPLGRLADGRARAGRPLLERVFLDDEPDLLEAPLDFLFRANQSRHVLIASSIFG